MSLIRHPTVHKLSPFSHQYQRTTTSHMQCCIVVLIWDMMVASYRAWGWRGRGSFADLSHQPLPPGRPVGWSRPQELLWGLFRLFILNIVLVCTLTYAFYVHILFNFTMNCPGKVINIFILKYWCVCIHDRIFKPGASFIKDLCIDCIFCIFYIMKNSWGLQEHCKKERKTSR